MAGKFYNIGEPFDEQKGHVLLDFFLSVFTGNFGYKKPQFLLELRALIIQKHCD